MVGICGVVGPDATDLAGLTAGIPTHADEVATEYADDGIALWTSFPDRYATDQPATAADGDVSLWVWGDVYGFDDGRTYTPRPDAPGDSAEYCADLYERHGMSAVEGLNGDFTLLLVDREAGTLSVVTDRLATRPVYYARTDAGQFVFASSVQALAGHPGVEPAFDESLLSEYLILRRVFGVETPLTGVRELPPASVCTLDLADRSLETDTYWRPRYRPVDKSLSTVVDELRETFARVLGEWTDEDLDCGVLLSGGSDSRALLAGLDQRVDAFHITDWMSRETRIAREVTAASGNDFHMLKRQLDTDADVLGTSPARSNFSGWFDQAYTAPFESEIRGEVDVLLSGLYADMLFGGGPLRTHEVSLGPVGNVSFPVERPVDSVDQYVTDQTAEAVEPVPYLSDGVDVASVIRERIACDGGRIRSHGVTYDSITDLVMYGDYYPMGADTDAIFSRGLMHICPYRTPFLDNRLLDLQQQVPRHLFVRRNLVNRIVEGLDPALAEIPHARTGIPLKHPFPVHFVGGNVNQFQWKHLADDEPAPHLDQGPWPNRDALIRQSEFTIDAIRSNRGLIDRLPFLDFDGAIECYHQHMNETNNATLLYSLLTLLEMPVTERIAGERASADVE
jgi:asparagine synthase (glutamine-hydrolysing)